MSYSSYKLTEKSRDELLEMFPAVHPDVICDHVTFRFPDSGYPSPCKTAKLVGYACDDSVEAFVVEINGSTKRPDGKIFHLTYSIDREKGAKPVDSNKLIADGYAPLAIKVDIEVKDYLHF